MFVCACVCVHCYVLLSDLLDDCNLAQVPGCATLNQRDVRRQTHPVHMVTCR